MSPFNFQKEKKERVVESLLKKSITSSPPRQYFEINSQRSLVKLDNVDFTPNIP